MITATCACGESLTFERSTPEQDLSAYGYRRSDREQRQEWLDWHRDHYCPETEDDRYRRAGHCELSEHYSLGQVPRDGDGYL